LKKERKQGREKKAPQVVKISYSIRLIVRAISLEAIPQDALIHHNYIPIAVKK
jgi:hypothetical protein